MSASRSDNVGEDVETERGTHGNGYAVERDYDDDDDDDDDDDTAAFDDDDDGADDAADDDIDEDDAAVALRRRARTSRPPYTPISGGSKTLYCLKTGRVKSTGAVAP